MKTRILAIVPYPGMQQILNDIVTQYEDIELTVRISSLEKAVEIARSYAPDELDVIIARGGTAERLQKSMDIPVVKIELTTYDILRAIKLAENYTSRFAIIGISAITQNATLLCNLMQYNIKTVTLNDYSDFKAEISELRKDGYEMVLCDYSTSHIAYELGLNHILITSSRESIETAFKQALLKAHQVTFYRHQAKLLEAAFSQSHEYVMIYDRDFDCVFSNLQNISDNKAIFEIIKTHLDSFILDNSFCLEEQTDRFFLSFRSAHIFVEKKKYFCIFLTRKLASQQKNDDPLSATEEKETISFESDSYGNANMIGKTRRILESYADTRQSVLILGEYGTGKDQAAAFIQSQSAYKSNPYCVIDCNTTNNKKWSYYMDHPDSPFNDLNSTIFIKDIHVLNEAVAKKLFLYLKSNEGHRQNRFLFSYTISAYTAADNYILRYLTTELLCLKLQLPPLRERVEDLSNIATLYISQANTELGKQVVGFESGAMDLIRSFSWSQNLAQFKRMIRELIVQTDGDYISVDQLRTALHQETQLFVPVLQPGYAIINLEQSLEEINRDIAQIVLEQENMNRTKTVEHLQISRTTLWRMLQK